MQKPPAKMNKGPPKSRVKNPCRICNQTVANKSGVQCKGACAKWAHFKCLGYPHKKILDIRDGIIKITCPCPHCTPKVPVQEIKTAQKEGKTIGEYITDLLRKDDPNAPEAAEQSPPIVSPRESPVQSPPPPATCAGPPRDEDSPYPPMPCDVPKPLKPCCPVDKTELGALTKHPRELQPRKQYLYKPYLRKQAACQPLHGRAPCVPPGQAVPPCHPTEGISLFEAASPKRSCIRAKDDFEFNPTSFEPQLFQPEAFKSKPKSGAGTSNLQVRPPCDAPRCRSHPPICKSPTSIPKAAKSPSPVPAAVPPPDLPPVPPSDVPTDLPPDSQPVPPPDSQPVPPPDSQPVPPPDSPFALPPDSPPVPPTDSAPVAPTDSPPVLPTDSAPVPPTDSPPVPPTDSPSVRPPDSPSDTSSDSPPASPPESSSPLAASPTLPDKTPPLSRTPSKISLVSPADSAKHDIDKIEKCPIACRIPPIIQNPPRLSGKMRLTRKDQKVSPMTVKISLITRDQDNSPISSKITWSKKDQQNSPVTTVSHMECPKGNRSTSPTSPTSPPPPCDESAPCQKPPPDKSLSCCKKCKNCNCSSSLSLLKSNCVLSDCPKNVLAKTPPKAPSPSLKSAPCAQKTTNLCMDCTSSICPQQFMSPSPSDINNSQKKPCMDCTSSTCPNQTGSPNVTSLEMCAVKKSKSCACLTALRETQMRTVVSDSTLPQTYNSMLFTAIDQLCTTMGQLSGQIKKLMSKMRVNA